MSVCKLVTAGYVAKRENRLHYISLKEWKEMADPGSDDIMMDVVEHSL